MIGLLARFVSASVEEIDIVHHPGRSVLAAQFLFRIGDHVDMTSPHESSLRRFL